jgi:hypothetical protein
MDYSAPSMYLPETISLALYPITLTSYLIYLASCGYDMVLSQHTACVWQHRQHPETFLVLKTC